jgi:hypothetical protein
MKVTYIIYAFLLTAISCGTSHKSGNLSNKSNGDAKIDTIDVNVRPFIKTRCDTMSMDYRICVTECAYKGDKKCIENITCNMPYFMRINEKYRTKFRGEKLFNHCIKISGKVFECGRDFDGEIDGSNEHHTYTLFYHEMIRTIDGLSVEKYLEREVPYTYERAIKDEEEKCKESRYREYYQTIKTAYEKGLVVLKDYGEE